MKQILIQIKKLGYLILLFSSNQLLGQEVLHATRLESENKGVYLFYTELFTQSGATYFTTITGGDQRLIFGDTILTGNREDSLIDYNRGDQFFIKMDSGHAVIDSWVIDNCESYEDYTFTNDYHIVLVNVWGFIDADSLAVMTMPDGTEVRREDHLGESILVFADTSMNYLEYRVPTTGRIKQIEGGSEILYMAIEIQEDAPYILLGTDTVRNYYNYLGSYPSSVLLAGYDINTGQFLWWNRLGSEWPEAILDFRIDQEENLYTLIHPGAITTYYGDTIGINSGTPPFTNILLKVNSSGEYLWSESFQGAEGEYLSVLEIDPEDNIYVNGILYGDYLTLFDTILYAPNNDFGQGIIIKFDPGGAFQWGFIVAGTHELSGFLDFTFDSTNNMYITGIAIDGNVILSGVEYTLVEDIMSPYIIKLDRENAKDLGHIWFEGARICRFHDIKMDALGRPITFLYFRGKKKLLGYELQSLPLDPSGFLITLSTVWDSIVSTKTPTPDLFRVYPNPVSQQGELHIQMNDNYFPENVTIQLMDMKGFIVGGLSNVTASNVSIDIANLIPGTYILLVEMGNIYFTKKLVIL